MLVAKRSAGVAPKVNLRILLHASEEAGKQGDPPSIWNPEETSPEVSNKGICVPEK